MQIRHEIVSFTALGTPRPGGSKSAFYIKALGRAIITDASKKVRPWMALVSDAAMQAYDGEIIAGVPLVLSTTFLMPRPKSHYRTGKHAGELKPNAPLWHIGKPDLTKLLRALEDALTGIVWHDDSQVVLHGLGSPQKRYTLAGERPGALVRVETIAPAEMPAQDAQEAT